MADDSYFLPEDASLDLDANELKADTAQDTLATAEQWAAMKFEPMLIDANKFGPGWEQTRGSIARAAISLLRSDDQALTRQFQSEPEPLLRVLGLHEGLEREIQHLKDHIEVLEITARRLLVVAERCVEPQP